MTNLCNLNGILVTEEKAVVPVLDRGFLFGDSIYEVVETKNGVPFALPEHLERLHGSADALMMRLDIDDLTLSRRIKETLHAAKNPESYVRVVVTRGVGTAPNIDVAYATGPCTVLIMVRPLPSSSSSLGHLAFVSRLRNDKRALDPASKTGNYLNNVLGLIEAKATGAHDAIFLNSAGYVTEATTSNIWIAQDEGVFTPPLSAGILAGVTRKLIFECCKEVGLRCEERDITPQQLLRAPEVFMSSTLRHVFPVTRIDDHIVGSGKPGPITTRLAALFQEFSARRQAEVYAPAWSKI